MTSVALNWKGAWAVDEELKSFFNWALIWILLANIGYMALWFVGGPMRWWEIGVIGFTGLFAKRWPFWPRYIAFLAVMVYSALVYLGGLFNLNISSLIYSIQFFLELKPANSIEYIGVGITILIILGLAFHLMRQDQNFSRPSLIVAAGALIIGLGFIDIQMGKGMRGHYKRSAPENALFTSASSMTEFAARADGKRHLLLVMVESLGVPKGNPEMARRLFALYKTNAAVNARYELSEGTSLYYNSTTGGEVRELCGRWGDYYDLLDRKDDSCMPAKLSKKGYNTVAMHSFTGDFFSRSTWYPNIGFQQRFFEDDFLRAGAQRCGGVFAGACDRYIPAQIAAKLKAAKKPTFLYWLTLNSHLPVPQGMNLNVDNCETFSATLQRDFPQICRQLKIYDDIDTALIREITARDFPETDILIVGDHMPPYFDRHHRSQFDPARVPWLYLKHKDSNAAAN